MTRGLGASGLERFCPFHLGFDDAFRVFQVGPGLAGAISLRAIGSDVRDWLALADPEQEINRKTIRHAEQHPVIVKICKADFRLHGQFVRDAGSTWFFGVPCASNAKDVGGLAISSHDPAPHDRSRGLLFNDQRDPLGVDGDLATLRREVNTRQQRDTAERALEIALNARSDFAVVVDRCGTVREANISPALTLCSPESVGVSLAEACPDLAHAIEPSLRILFECDDLAAFEFRTGSGSAPTHLDCRARRTTNGEALIIGRDVTEKRRLEHQLAHQAMHDALTDLPNRVLLKQRVQRTLAGIARARDSRRAALLLIDLDGFNSINDIMGHAVGDGLLQTIARRLECHLRPDDVAARIGGDDFGVLLDHLGHTSQALEIAHRLQDVIHRRAVIQGADLRPRCSIGVAVTTGSDDAESIFRRADLAIQRAKREENGAVELFDDELQRRATRRLQLKRDLENALERDEFVLHYQPIVELETQKLIGAEALVRWRHPEQGRLGPDAFIGLAEETGLIEPLGRRILHMACHQAAYWQKIAPCKRPLQVSVNLSAKQLSGPGIVDVLLSELRDSHLDPTTLTLEITESHVVTDVDETVRILEPLRALGARIAMDDFGTGYSSLSYLERLPIDVLKIDKAFVDRLAGEDPAILAESVVGLGLALGMHVIAEGIEQASQAERLQTLGCQFGQGYLYSPPVEASTLTEWIKSAAPQRPTIVSKSAESAG